ncbi:MAG: hypothetical protein ABFD83_00615 [Armatimonadota bacterium]
MRNLMLICLVLAVVSVSTVRADHGRVVYLYSAELAKSSDNGANAPTSGRIDVMESDLRSGKRSTLINGFYNGAYQDFAGSSIAVSCNGGYVAIGQSPTIAAISDADIKLTPSGLRLWDRKTRRVRTIYPGYTNEQLLWSGSGRYLAIVDPYSDGPVRIYDAYLGRMKAYSGYGGFTCAAWSAKRNELILVVSSTKKGSTIYAQPVTGRRRVLFRWRDTIDAVAELGDGTGYALCDGIGVFLYKSNGRTKRLPIHRSHNDPWGITLLSQSKGSWMAALASYSYGEPHVNTDEALYALKSDGCAFRRIAKWQSSYLSIQPDGGSIIFMEAVGWLKNPSKVVLRGQVTWGGEAVVDNRSDQFQFWTFDMPHARIGKMIFDSGPGCLSAAWWSD